MESAENGVWIETNKRTNNTNLTCGVREMETDSEDVDNGYGAVRGQQQIDCGWCEKTLDFGRGEW